MPRCDGQMRMVTTTEADLLAVKISWVELKSALKTGWEQFTDGIKSIFSEFTQPRAADETGEAKPVNRITDGPEIPKAQIRPAPMESPVEPGRNYFWDDKGKNHQSRG